MASAIEDAMAGLLVARINPSPMGGATSKLVDQIIAEGDVDLDRKKMAVMRELQEIIADAQAKSADPKVIAGFQRMLDKYN